MQVSTVEHPPQSAPVLVDRRRAAEFLREVRALQELGLAGDISLETVYPLPACSRRRMRSKESGHLCAEHSVMGSRWLARHARPRRRSPQKELLRAVARMTARLRRVKTLAPRVPKRQRAALFTRLQAARLPVDLLDPRITTEIAVFAERCDITEELADSTVISGSSAITSRATSRSAGLSNFSLRRWVANGTPLVRRRTTPRFPSLSWRRKPSLIRPASNWPMLNSSFQRTGILSSSPRLLARARRRCARPCDTSLISFMRFHAPPARSGEVEGEDYQFLSKDEFEARRSWRVLKNAEVHGNKYRDASGACD